MIRASGILAHAHSIREEIKQYAFSINLIFPSIRRWAEEVKTMNDSEKRKREIFSASKDIEAVLKRHRVSLVPQSSVKPAGKLSRFIFKVFGRFIKMEVENNLIIK